jgi:hypothetical protein
MRLLTLLQALTIATLLNVTATSAVAQTPDPPSRVSVVAEAQADKLPTLHPYIPTTGERLMDRAEKILLGTPTWHPFFQNAYSGGGFAAGLGYMFHLSSYNSLDVRGSYSLADYKRAEAEFVAPRLFHRRGELAILAGWRDATQVAFYGFGTNTSANARANYGFEQPHASARLTLRPTRRLLMLRGGTEFTRWNLKSGAGGPPSVDTIYTPDTLPGLGTDTTYLHTQATVGFDWRPAAGYARRGGFYGVTAHDFYDKDSRFGFRQLDYEAVQHIPILRESWVISLHGLARTTSLKDGQEIPFYVMPSLGGGSDLRGYSSWRFRDRNSMLLQAEWRIMVNRFFDTAVFYEAGKVTAHTKDLDFDGLKSDYGFGARFHSPFATPLRIDVARSNEGTRLVFAATAAF